MKHPPTITTLLVFLFLSAQLVGMGLVYLDADKTVEDGQPRVEYGETVIGARPDASPEQIFLVLAIGIAIGTVLLMVFIKWEMLNLWKLWFFAAVFLSLFIALGVILPYGVAFSVGLVLAAWKILRPGPIIHNTTELFVYAGIVILVAPLFNLLWAIILLLAISLYDMYAVWQSKHMVTLAEASTKHNLMAGLYLPRKKSQPFRPPGKPGKMAVLGGGDIAFPLLFSSVVFTWLVNDRGLLHWPAFLETLIITLCCTIVIGLIFTYSKKGKFYPAMPFLSLGCFAGLAVIALL